jgi:hypothetical protein
MEHVIAPEPPRQRGEVQSHKTRGSAGAHLGREAGFRAAGHVAVP